MKKLYILHLYFFVTLANSLYSQCSLYPVSLSSRVNASSVVVEGKVLSQKSFWNAAHNYISTSNLLSIKTIFKGSLNVLRIEIVTEGGEIGLKKQTVEPSLQLNPGDEGVFTLNAFEQASPQFGFSTFKPYADAQSFIKYDLTNDAAYEPFKKYNSINGDLYPELEKILGIDLPDYVNPSGNKGYSPSTINSVTGLSPLNITAGTSSILTITGSGFGSSQSTSFVEFYNADDGGSTFIKPDPTQYISWSNTQIQVLVPTKTGTVAGTAGTGPVRVTVAGSPTLSAQTLTVDYGELNVFYSGNNTIYNTRHVDLNGSAGVTWQMYTSFDVNTAAKNAFLRSFQTWRCNTYVNWILGSTTTTNVIASDGVNVIRFDIGTELPVGVLGRCTSYFSGCITGTVINFFVDELDICFDEPSTSAITWQFGPTLASGVQYDFESVSLHELGHGHQLSHVINSNDVMHYALANSQNKRSLITQNINGGNDVMTRNVSPGVCGMSAMVALNPTICGASAPTASFTITSTVCTGQSIALNDLSSSGPTSWSWTMTGGSPGSSTIQNTSTTFSAAGLYSISLIATNGFGSSAIFTKTISVVAQPTLSVSSATICSGSSTLLTVSGAASYTWNPGVLTGTSQILNPSSTAVYTINGSNGTCAGTITSTVTVITTPTINAPNATICSGASTLITAGGATSYTWNPGGLTGSSQNLNPGTTSTFTVNGANSSCTSNVVTFTITVNTTPTLSVSDATICSGASTLLSAGGATSYTWNPGGLNGASQNLSPGTTTIYTVTGTNGSCSSSAFLTVNVSASPTVSVPNAFICSGGSTLITANGAASYTWNPGNLTGASQNLNPSSTAIYTVTGTTGICTQTITTTVSVTTTPTLNVANAFICSGTSTLITATGAASYIWNPGGLSGASQNLSPGSTTVYTVTGSIGTCTNSSTSTVSVTITPTVSVPNSFICSGNSTLVTASGATSYTWNPGNLTGAAQSLNPLSTIVYIITGNNGACTHSITTTVNVTTTPTLSVASASICSGTSTLITATGATSYIWNPGSLSGASQNLSPGSTTIYSITGSIGTCTNSATSTVSVNITPTVSVASAFICSGTATLLSATGATSYTWNPGNLTGSSQNLNPGSTTNYSVSGSIGTCTSISTTTINVTITPTIVVSNGTLCLGASVVKTVTGATNYTWNPGALSGAAQTLTPASTTIYTVTGGNGICVNTKTAAVTVYTLPTVFAIATPPSICNGGNSTLAVGGGNSYTWNPGNLLGVNPIVSPSLSTIYTVAASDATCINTTTVSLQVNPNPTVSVIQSPYVCSGSSIVITASGADTYTWNPGGAGATKTLNPLSTTPYTISGTYTNTGCNSFGTTTLSVFPKPSVSASANPTVICTGITTTLIAGGALNYTWVPGGATGSNISVSPATNSVYTVTGFDGFCTNTAVVSVSVNPNPPIIVNNMNVCTGYSVSPTVGPGGAISFTWNPGNIVALFPSLGPLVTTVYTVTGINANGCRSTVNPTVFVSPSPTLNVVASQTAVCPGLSTTLTASGANTYTWDFGISTNSTTPITPTASGSHYVTGQIGTCTASTSVVININPLPGIFISAFPTFTICSGGTTTLQAGGANTYTWNPIGITGSIISVSPSVTTIYTITGTSALGCTNTSGAFITVVPTPTINITASQTTLCSGNSTTLTANGASNYTWTPGLVTGSTAVFTPNSPTLYQVIGNTGPCTSTSNLVVIVNPNPVLSSSVSLQSICSGMSTALSASGAVTYSWSPGNISGTQVTVSPNTTTTYTVTGYGSFGCTSTSTAQVSVSPSPTLNPIATPTSVCVGNSSTLTASGATSYTWLPGSSAGSSLIVTPTAPVVYQVTGILGNCTATAPIMVSVNSNPTLVTSNLQPVICAGDSFTSTVIGANAYTWNPGNLTGSIVSISPAVTTIYTVSGTNAVTNCSASASFTLSVIPTPTITITSSQSSICAGISSTLIANGAANYTWNPGNLNGPSINITPQINVTYTVNGSNGNCNSTTAMINISVSPNPTISVSASKLSICPGESVTLTSSGANNYTCVPGNFSGNPITVSPITSTDYTITGESMGCVGTNSLTVINVLVCDNIAVVDLNFKLKIYPNPAHDAVTLNFGEPFSGEITLFNAVGQLITIKRLDNIDVMNLNLYSYAQGVYLLKIQGSDNKITLTKLIVQ